MATKKGTKKTKAKGLRKPKKMQKTLPLGNLPKTGL